jgi:hypothetical protein
MLEVWFKRAKTGWCDRRGPILRVTARIPTAAWGGEILILAFLLAGARPFWHYTHPPDEARLDAIADEVGSIGFMIQDHHPRWFAADAPLVNHTGTQVLFCRTSENGAAVFRLDLATGEKTKLFEEPADRFSAGPATVLSVYAWSPDDAKILYSRAGPTPAWELVDARADTGQELAALEIFRIRKAIWLTPESFVCVDPTGAIHWIKEQPDKNWKEVEIISLAGGPARGKLRLVQKQPDGTAKDLGTISVNGRYDNLAALSDNAIAWQEGNQIVALDLSAKTATALLKLQSERLKEFTYSPATGRFWLSCAEKGQDSLWRRIPGEETLQDSNLVGTANVNVRLWLNGGKGFVYFNPTGQLLAQTNAGADPQTILAGGHIGALAATPDGKRLVILGAASRSGLRRVGIRLGGQHGALPGACCRTRIPTRRHRHPNTAPAFSRQRRSLV